MSSDPLSQNTVPNSSTPGDPVPTATKPVEAQKKFLDLSLTQLIGGSLAAATAAGLGSRLGVAGTIIGAALISVMSATGAAFYTASLRRGRKTVQTVVVAARSRLPQQPNTATSVLPTTELVAGPTAPATAEDSDRVPRTITKKPIVIGAIAFFLVAILGVTGIELISGSAISGGGGTTVGRFVGVDKSTTPASPSTSEQRPDTSQSPATSGSHQSQSGSSASAPSNSSSAASSDSSSAQSSSSASSAASDSAANSDGAAPTTGGYPDSGAGSTGGAVPSGTTVTPNAEANSAS